MSDGPAAPAPVRRVLLVAPAWHGGGAIRCSRELFQELTSRGIAVRMFVASASPDDPPGVQVIRFPGERYLRLVDDVVGPVDWRFPGAKFHFARVGPGDFDVIHLHNIHPGFLSLKSVAAACRRIPSVWTLHDEFAVNEGVPYDLQRVMPAAEIERRWPRFASQLDAHHPRARVRRERFARWMPKTTLTISPSEYMARLAGQHPRFAGTPIFRIPYGVKMLDQPFRNTPRQEARRHFGLDPEQSVVLMLAANFDSAYKGMTFAADALQKLNRSVQLLLLGPRHPEMFQAFGRCKIVAPGWVTDDAVIARAYRAADLTLIPSIAENFPYVGLESMACATPPVAFRVGGMVEMLGDNEERGLLARALDTDHLADRMNALLADPARASALGEAGRSWVESRCVMDAFVRANLDVYRQARERHAGAGTR